MKIIGLLFWIFLEHAAFGGKPSHSNAVLLIPIRKVAYRTRSQDINPSEKPNLPSAHQCSNKMLAANHDFCQNTPLLVSRGWINSDAIKSLYENHKIFKRDKNYKFGMHLDDFNLRLTALSELMNFSAKIKNHEPILWSDIQSPIKTLAEMAKNQVCPSRFNLFVSYAFVEYNILWETLKKPQRQINTISQIQLVKNLFNKIRESHNSYYGLTIEAKLQQSNLYDEMSENSILNSIDEDFLIAEENLLLAANQFNVALNR